MTEIIVSKITSESFDEMYELSEKLVQEYIASQKTDKQISYAKQHLHSMTINKHYLKSQIDKGGIHICKRCGILTYSAYSDGIGERMREKQICFYCDHWEQLSITQNPKRLIINGETYSDAGYSKDKHSFLGFGGRIFKYERNAQLIETNNMWYGGVIPEEYRSAMPDNAKFV